MKKSMNFSVLQALRESAVHCYDGYHWFAPNTFIKHYEELQETINIIDKDGIHDFFNGLNVNNHTDDCFCVPESTLIILKTLQEFITCNRASLAKIFPNIEDIDDFCSDFIPFLEKELQMLYERKDIDADEEDVYALDYLNKYSTEKWINKFISRDEIPVRTKIRRLRLALKTDDIDEEKQTRLRETLKQIEEAEKKKLATKELEDILREKNVGDDIINSFFTNYPKMKPNEFKHWYNQHLKDNLNLTAFWRLCLKIDHSDEKGKPCYGWGYKNIASH